MIEATLQAEDLFDSLEKEKEQEVREFKVKRTKGLDRILKNCDTIYDKNGWRTSDYLHNEIFPFEIAKRCTAKDIEYFSFMHPEYDKPTALRFLGSYISGLINFSERKKFVLRPQKFELYNLGFRNNGNKIIIYGSVGGKLGSQMYSGDIIVHGNVGESLGSNLYGGNIHVKGNAGNFVGHEMVAGMILVEGNVGRAAGSFMHGGLIHIKGDAGDFIGSDMNDGDIIVDGNGGRRIGWSMYGGSIHLDGSYIGISKKIISGKIFRNGILKWRYFLGEKVK